MESLLEKMQGGALFWVAAASSATIITLGVEGYIRDRPGGHGWNEHLILAAGVVGAPLGSALGRFSRAMVQSDHAEMKRAVRLIPLVLLYMFVGFLFGVSRKKFPPITYSLDVWMAAVISALGGVLNAFPGMAAQVSANALLGVLTLPLIESGIYLGRLARFGKGNLYRDTKENRKHPPPGPWQLLGLGVMAIVISILATFIVAHILKKSAGHIVTPDVSMSYYNRTKLEADHYRTPGDMVRQGISILQNKV